MQDDVASKLRPDARRSLANANKFVRKIFQQESNSDLSGSNGSLDKQEFGSEMCERTVKIYGEEPPGKGPTDLLTTKRCRCTR